MNIHYLRFKARIGLCFPIYLISTKMNVVSIAGSYSLHLESHFMFLLSAMKDFSPLTSLIKSKVVLVQSKDKEIVLPSIFFVE